MDDCWERQAFRHMHGMMHHGFGHRFGFRPWDGPRPSREDQIRFWEEYQKDLEEELADVAGRIERLKKSQTQESAAAA